MAGSETIIWTALPNGVDTARGVVRLSAHVGLRVFPAPGSGTLGGFAVGRWPELGWDLSVEVSGPGGTALVPATRIAPGPGLTGPDVDLWNRLFPPATDVVGYPVSDLPTRTIRSAPVTNLRTLVAQAWEEWARRWPTSIPTTFDIFPREGGPFRPATPIFTGDLATGLAAHEDRLAGVKALPSPVPGSAGHDPARDPVRDLLEHTRFFHRPSSVHGARGASTIDVVEAPHFDFHEVLAMVGQHPVLMRRLGLVIDLEVPFSALASVAGAQLVLTRIVPTPQVALAAGVRTVLPQTASTLTSTSFVARPGPGNDDLAAGALRFDNAAMFRPIEFDVDGAALKLGNYGRELEGLGAVDAERPQGSAPFPALRSFGLGVNRRNHAVAKAARFAQMGAFEQAILGGNPPLLYAEHLVRGLRIHVHDGRWRSLLRRRGRYVVGRGADTVVIESADEGWVTAAPTSSVAAPGATADPDLYLQESLFLWSGWSLAAPRPGLALDDNQQLVESEVNRVPEGSNVTLNATFRPEPGSLPSLRFGRTYRFRAHTVDLAGNSLPFGDELLVNGSGPTSPDVVHRRFDPIEQPAVLLRRPRTEGETVERVVIRTDPDLPPSAVTPAERHIAPPRTSQLTAEQHGLFDIDGRLDHGLYTTLCRRDAFTLANSPQATVEPSGPGDPDGVPASVYYDLDAIDIGYLTDPLAAGVLLRDVPGAPDGRLVVPFTRIGDRWPDRRSVRLRLIEGTGAPTVVDSATGAIVTIQVPKGSTNVVRYNSWMDPATPGLENLLGVLTFLELGPPESAANTRATILRSEAWMVTPYRELTLVSASRRPVLEPKLASLVATRSVGSTVATLTATLTRHRPSTARIEVMANWTDHVDPGLPLDIYPSMAAALAAPGPTTVSARARAFEVPVGSSDEPAAGDVQRADLRHDLGDTRHRSVTYTPVATSAFAEYFVERATPTLVGVVPVTVSPDGFVDGSVRVTDVSRATAYEIGTDVEVDHAAGTVRRLDPSTVPDGSAVEIAFVRPDVTRVGPPVTIEVPSTARPASPAVRYLVPTFRWQKGGDGVIRRTSNRKGNAVRVWLDRPWFSSGDGEMLGVVIEQRARFGTNTPAAPATLSPYVSQFGNDPISGGGNVTGSKPQLSAFPLRSASATGRSLAELPGTVVDVAAHAVSFDDQRKLWYSDIEVNAGGSYFPFVRLALARYQPASVAGVELSPVVLADFIQLTPDRAATVTFDPLDPRKVTLTVTGRSYTSFADQNGNPQASPTLMEVWVERQDIAGAGDLSWAPPAGAVAVPLTGSVDVDGAASWTGTITLLGNRFTTPQRLVIDEYEQRPMHNVDVRSGGRRIVYSDIIRL